MRIPFERAVTDHGATVWRVCRAVCGEHADDAWSVTFLKALTAWPDLPDDANVRAWLVTIAHHAAIDELRGAGRRAVPIDPHTLAAADDPAAATRSSAPGAENAAGLWLADRDLWSAVAALPQRQRQCVAYRYFAGLPYAQIAELTGGTAAAARRATADGIASLRQQFALPVGADRAADSRDPSPAAAYPAEPLEAHRV